jgi:hypothetical protein
VSNWPWSKDAPPPILPPAAGPAPSWPPPGAAGGPGRAGAPAPRRGSAGPTLRLLLTVAVAAAVGSAITYGATRNDRVSTPQPPVSVAPRFSQADMDAAKQHLCHVFDVSLGREGHGGFRVEGNLNVPVTLQSVTSAVAVQNALGPAVPPDVASAARKYISTTLDAVTAAMGDSSISDINRLTNTSNDAVSALLDVCGLPR